uniref:Uncharacterized protein n=1 Tax=Ditylenchus dipsaci TaxID=166011 RepID=A0A915EHT6_9BILA
MSKQLHHSHNGQQHINGAAVVAKAIPSPLAFKDHPAVVANATMSKTVVNPRLTYYTAPIVLSSLAKIKQRMLSAENLTAWASDNTPSLLSSAASRRNHRQGSGHFFSDTSRRLAVAFGSSFGEQSRNSNSLCVFTMNAEGVLTEHRMDVRRERHNSSGSTSSLNVVEPLSSSPINSGIMHTNMPKLPHFSMDSKKKQGHKCGAKETRSRRFSLASSCRSCHLLWSPSSIVDGPQFSFGVYSHSDHSSAQLFNPNDDGYTPSSFPTSQKCCPVLIEKNPTNLGLLNCDTSLDSASRIVCGSWSSDIDFKTAFSDGTYAAVKEKIEDAMRCDVQQEDKLVKNRHISKRSSNNSSGSNSLGQNMDLMQLSGMDL